MLIGDLNIYTRGKIVDVKEDTIENIQSIIYIMILDISSMLAY